MKLNKINKTLLQNFTSLSILNLANYLFPMITLPYLVRVLGPEKYGLVNFAAAFVGYFGILTDYGFNLSATREISIHRNDKEKLIQIYNSVLSVKFILFLLSTTILSIILITIPFFAKNYLVYLLSFGTVFGSVLFPIWFFQGMENMKYITILNIIFRSIATIFIFILITQPAHFHTLILINSMSIISIGIAATLLIFFIFKIPFRAPSKSEILFQFKEGWSLFISSFAISLYTISNTFILGLFADLRIVGYFSAADKIRAAFQGLFSTISQTVYPHFANTFNKSVKHGLSLAKKILRYVGFASFIVSLLLFIFASEVVTIILGKEYVESVLVLKIISWLIFLVALSNISGIQVMLNLSFKKAFSQIIIVGAIINIVLSFVLVPLIFEIGSSISVFITESFVTFAMFLFLSKKEIKLFVGVHG
ncbi:MAG: flippase [bacterium]